MDTLLKYTLSPCVEAFSTTRISPTQLTSTELEAMGNYAAFNVTHYCGDDLDRVTCNRQWLCSELGISEHCLWLPRQTHTDNVACIDDDFLKLSKAEQTERLENIDALITNIPRQCIGVSTADCVPVIIFDERNQAIAAIHAGWRGTVQHISQKALSLMRERYGTNPHDCCAVIGPSISLEAYEVGEELIPIFKEAGFPSSLFSLPSSHTPLPCEAKPHLDLWAANLYLLENAGIPLTNIQVSGICTYQHADTFFSARRLGIKSGRIYSAAMLR